MQPDVIRDDDCFIVETTQQAVETDVMAIAQRCNTSTELIEQITVSQSELTKIEENTVGQSDNSLWHRVRKGRITASNFYRVHTKVESLKQKPTASCESLVESLINPPLLSHLPQIAKGSENERVAAAKFVDVLIELGHKNVMIKSCGFYIDKNKQYLGASPDGIVTCDCCPPSLLEIKCPSKSIAQLSYLNETKKLKAKSNYYGQVQGQMAVTGIPSSYFFIYYSAKEHNVEHLKFDATFCAKMVANLEFFYVQYLAPALMRHKKRRLQ